MANKGSAAKRHRQNLKRRLRNKMVKSRVRSRTRDLLERMKEEPAEQTGARFTDVSGLLDSAASKRVIHRNAAARKKRRLHKAIAAAVGSAEAQGEKSAAGAGDAGAAADGSSQ